jgi:hypothetical protein
MAKSHRPTFRQHLEETHIEAAIFAWDRATAASRLRHGLVAQGRRRDARMMGELKARCLGRAREILPGEVRVTTDTDYLVGMVSVPWRGHGRRHLPTGSLAKQSA